MWTGADAAFLNILRFPCRITTTATHVDPVTATETPLDVLGGSVTADSTATNRRTLTITLPALQDVYDLLSAPGGEITVRQTVSTGTYSKTVPQGVFRVMQHQFGYASGDTFDLTCPDRSGKIQQNRFGVARASAPSNTVHAEIQRLVEGAWPGSTYPFPGWAQLDTSVTDKVGQLMWDDGDRWGAITSLCAANGLEFFFDASGLAVLRPIPTLTTTSVPVWTVDASTPTAVLTAATRAGDMSVVHNAVIVTTSATDVTFDPVAVENTTAGDPLNITGPLGYCAVDYTSANLRNSDQARAAGKQQLTTQLGQAKQLTLEAISNPALDAEDVILVKLPKIDRNTGRPSELQIVEQVTHPLLQGDEGGSPNAQQILTRSTRPDTDGT